MELGRDVTPGGIRATRNVRQKGKMANGRKLIEDIIPIPFKIVITISNLVISVIVIIVPNILPPLI